MAAGQGFKTFVTGEVLTAGDVNGYLMQGINVFTNATARDAAITAPAEGQFAFTKDNNSLWYYDGAAWVASGATGDIEGVTAGVGISGGGTSGTVTVTNSMATAIDAKGDLVPGTGADTFARLAVGANNTVLTADSAEATGLKWATPSGGNLNWSLLNPGGTALTAAQNITISGLSSENLAILITGASSASASSVFSLRVNNDFAANYRYFGWSQNPGATYSIAGVGQGGGENGGIAFQFGTMSTAAGAEMNAYMELNGCKSGDLVNAYWTAGMSPSSGNDPVSRVHGGFYDGSAVVTSLVFRSTVGNWDGGTVYVYGA